MQFIENKLFLVFQIQSLIFDICDKMN